MQKPRVVAGFFVDWARKDSNLRRHKPSDLQSDSESPEVTEQQRLAAESAFRWAHCWALLPETEQSELFELLSAWPVLPADVRQQILATVRREARDAEDVWEWEGGRTAVAP